MHRSASAPARGGHRRGAAKRARGGALAAPPHGIGRRRSSASSAVGTPARPSRRVTFSQHGALEGDRQLSVIACAMQRETLVNRLVTVLCDARTGALARGPDFVQRCFAEGEQLVDELREQTVTLVDAVRFWQQAYVQAPPFRFEGHPNYLTHVVVSLDFVHSFVTFRKRLGVDGRRNPFMIPNARPTGDLGRWATFREYHEALLRLESRDGPAAVPVRKRVARCLAETATHGDAAAAAKDAATAAAALKKKRRADERYLAKVAAKQAEIDAARREQAQRIAEIRDEMAERVKVRGDLLREEQAAAAAAAAAQAQQRQRREREEKAERRRVTARREAAARKLAEEEARRREDAAVREEAVELRRASMRRAAAAAQKEVRLEKKEEMERRKAESRRFAEQARADREKQSKIRAKMESIKAKRTRKTMALVQERATQREAHRAEARVAREREAAQRRTDAVNRVAAAGTAKPPPPPREAVGTGRGGRAGGGATTSPVSRFAGYSKSIQQLGKRKTALAAAERQLKAARRRRDEAAAAGDADGVRNAELAFGTLQESVEGLRRQVRRLEHELEDWGSRLQPIMAGAGAPADGTTSGTATAIDGASASNNGRRGNVAAGHKGTAKGAAAAGKGKKGKCGGGGSRSGSRRTKKKRKKRGKRKGGGTDIGSLLLGEGEEGGGGGRDRRSADDDFDSDDFDSDSDSDDDDGSGDGGGDDGKDHGGGGAGRRRRLSHGAPASPGQPRGGDPDKLYQEATSWETSYSSMVITPHMRAVAAATTTAVPSAALQGGGGGRPPGPPPPRAGATAGSGSGGGGLRQEDLVRMGMEAALKLPPLAGVGGASANSRRPAPPQQQRPPPGPPRGHHQQAGSEEERRQWHEQYGRNMTLEATPVVAVAAAAAAADAEGVAGGTGYGIAGEGML